MNVPPFVYHALEILQKGGHQAWLVGGSLRDFWLGLKPKDWDIATSAMPDQVMALFDPAFPSGLEFGTVTVLLEGQPLEITTFRREKGYTTKRKPEKIELGVNLEEDLSRRDFTVNALAYDPLREKWVDPYGVITLLSAKKLEIKAVGDAEERFEEDPLRMLRAFYLMARAGAAGAEVSWDEATLKAISTSRRKILRVSAERIRDELTKILLGPNPDECLDKMQETGLLDIILPEVSRNKGVFQGNRHYQLDVFEHILQAVRIINPSPLLRWAALLHDTGKYACRVEVGDAVHFYGHEDFSASLAQDILKRLRFSNEFQERLLRLITNHMFTYPTTDAGVRRFLRRVGPDLVQDLLELRRADILATAPGAGTEELDRFRRRLAEIQNQKPAFGLKDLAVNGYDIMEHLNLSPGPQVGRALNYLLERVLEEPSLNTREALLAELKKWAEGRFPYPNP
ncbi:CCA tRNA nucleotidyltransferase [Thermanaeromonas sp. C210]|uniref:CCA tRNA nucleotidyltransferase n=1 Tax=Thermanaeromonas sp. C210 TaxID=2731925 RepID=UPI00155C0896|nr:CCA tRNA nucleotidyltransferase [Thermanaeromonas sp. C210]GFN22798.1 HDIG domain-containing protein [Thermanaeromonas sp. C210]